METTVGWVSIGIGLISIFIGNFAYIISLLSGWLLDELKIGTPEEVKSRGPKPVYFGVPICYKRLLFRIFGAKESSKTSWNPLKVLCFWWLLLLVARPTKDIPQKGIALLFDAGNLASTLGTISLIGSGWSILFGIISIGIGIAILVLA